MALSFIMSSSDGATQPDRQDEVGKESTDADRSAARDARHSAGAESEWEDRAVDQEVPLPHGSQETAAGTHPSETSRRQ